MPIAVGSDAKARSEIYSATTLASVVGRRASGDTTAGTSTAAEPIHEEVDGEGSEPENTDSETETVAEEEEE